MKVLIADDEEHVREGIELSVDWEAYGVTEKYMAGNGMEALEIMLAHRPDILFCDMKMPIMNGGDLLKRIREEGLPTQVIVISGYNDFEYTRATIQANAIDYILKPFRRADVQEAFRKAVSAWKEKHESQHAQVEQAFIVRKADALLDEKKLAAYLRGETPLTDAIRRIFEKTGLSPYGCYCLMLVPQNRADVLSRRFLDDEDLFVFAIDNIARDSLGGKAKHYICRLDNYQWVLLLDFPNDELGGSDLWFYLERLKKAWHHTISLQVLIGINPHPASLSALQQALGGAQHNLLQLNVGTGSLAEESAQPLPSLMAQKMLLKQAVESGNHALAEGIVRRYTEELQNRGKLLLKELQACTREANVLLGMYGQLVSSQSGGVKDFAIPLWVAGLQEWERSFITQVCLLIEMMNEEPSEGRDIQAIRAHLDQFYHTNISLKEIAEHFHFSPQYISKKFRETYDTTIITYLTNRKIEKAKALLSHTKLSVYDISNQIGYEDENYFGKVFKKQTGVSALQYRKQMIVK
ncbi:response regulator [Paenibacillaceae bacterium]|nr:response regulator [Paenibacillaceae bacterium]